MSLSGEIQSRQLRPSLMPQRDRSITFRSVSIGFAAVILICAFTPYNDYALNNTFLIGNCLPLSVIVLLFLFAALVNGPLNRFAPAKAFTSGEMTVMLSLMLVGCALPSSGLMRYLPPTLVMPFYNARSDPGYLALLQSMHIPKWLFPSFRGSRPADWVNDPVVTGYYEHWSATGRDGKPLPIPYSAWLRPALAWGIFFLAAWGAIFCLIAIVRRQWIENERLMFPLAQIELALVERPEPGKWFNRSLSGYGFWIAFSAVLFIRMWNGLGTYFPQVPDIPLGYDLKGLFTSAPFSYATPVLYQATIYFIVLGTAFFLSSSVAFSLWVFVILQQIFMLAQGSVTGDGSYPGAWDQHFGAVIAFAMSIIWLGRAHWRLVAAQAFRGHREGETRGRYLSYRTAFWGLIGCAGAMIAWLTLAGASVAGSACIVLLLLLLILVITRVIAETGLVYGQLLVPLYRPWQLLAISGFNKPVSTETFFLSSVVNLNFFDFREPLSVYASHALKVADQTFSPDELDETRARSSGKKLFALMFIAVVLAYAVSFASTLWTQYHFAYTMDAAHRNPINEWGCGWPQRGYIMDPTIAYQSGRVAAQYSPGKHIIFGFIVTAVLSLLRARFAWWPLHPVGYLMLPTNPAQIMWFSIFIGWVCKALIVRFGGSSLYQKARPFFLGLIVGDCAAAGLWLVVSLVLSARHIPYRAVNFMPL
jgi:hypothetical protein